MKPYHVAQLVKRSSLTAIQRAVLLRVAFYAGADSWCWAKVATIAADTGYSTRAVRRALGDLWDLGCLEGQRSLGGRPGLGSTSRIRPSGTVPVEQDAGLAKARERRRKPTDEGGPRVTREGGPEVTPPRTLGPAEGGPRVRQLGPADPILDPSPPTPRSGGAPSEGAVHLRGTSTGLPADQAPVVGAVAGFLKGRSYEPPEPGSNDLFDMLQREHPAAYAELVEAERLDHERERADRLTRARHGDPSLLDEVGALAVVRASGIRRRGLAALVEAALAVVDQDGGAARDDQDERQESPALARAAARWGSAVRL